MAEEHPKYPSVEFIKIPDCPMADFNDIIDDEATQFLIEYMQRSRVWFEFST